MIQAHHQPPGARLPPTPLVLGTDRPPRRDRRRRAAPHAHTTLVALTMVMTAGTTMTAVLRITETTLSDATMTHAIKAAVGATFVRTGGAEIHGNPTKAGVRSSSIRTDVHASGSLSLSADPALDPSPRRRSGCRTVFRFECSDFVLQKWRRLP